MTRVYADDNALPTGWRTRQPGTAIWLFISVLYLSLLALFYSIYYIAPPLRQSSTWTYRQAFTTRFSKLAVNVVYQIGFSQSLTLDPGSLGDRFVLMHPAAAECYRGPLASKTTKPETIGGTWYPSPPPKPSPSPSSSTSTTTTTTTDDGKSLIVLSFHGSAFLWLNGRPDDSGYTADLLNNTLGPNTRSLWIQYRLAGGDNPTPFPGPIQDALTAYLYLINDLHISPSRIVLAGDSAGATMAVALLRYLASFDPHSVPGHPLSDLPPPRACLLFSPSVEYTFEGDAHAWDSHRNAPTDYCDGTLAAWGARVFAPPDVVRFDDPYLSPALFPFATPVPIFVQVGGAEVLCDSAKGFVRNMAEVPGNRLQLLEMPGLPHDIYMIGMYLGWKEEQSEMIREAARFAIAG
ncbi:alpha/beta-hydrolase [Aspergillus heteromorphus CBS 117.55]|uniref:Alpha/beta-hydrolase n=1 Tax=Aspergillus heteromorphus CBS 117.55 TaxID=1448321 RepID=A0A317WFD8_9EURO|nr:alpha/beta-hydrolase [Aspergillus heteromorphus CBS 117.55]PWY85009.1 alpha/beta-hydrolase [Aspergillus heteromorphus CBS 117.55]